jgi:hypothetical protein
MPANRLKFIIITLFLVLILACVNTGGISPDTSARIRILSVLFDESQRKEFFLLCDCVDHASKDQ